MYYVLHLLSSRPLDPGVSCQNGQCMHSLQKLNSSDDLNLSVPLTQTRPAGEIAERCSSIMLINNKAGSEQVDSRMCLQQ